MECNIDLITSSFSAFRTEEDQKGTEVISSTFSFHQILEMQYRKAKSLSRIVSWLDFELRFFLSKKKNLRPPYVIMVSSPSVISILNGFIWRKWYKEYFKNPSYFNSSIIDTLSGEYWRSINKKTDYYHIFDYWTWDEEIVDSTLKSYNWEWANDTPTSWLIGDGTAALYNYVYYTVAVENQPRYESIQWYLESIVLEFESVIKTISSIPKLYEPAVL